MLFQAHGIVATAVEALAVDAAEVADTRHCNRDQTIQEFIHPVTAQGYFRTQRHFFADAETSNGFLGNGCHGLLTSNRCQIFLSRFGFLAVTDSFSTTADVQNDFVQTRDLHFVLVAELFLESGTDRVVVNALQAGCVSCVIKHRSRPPWFLRSGLSCRPQP